MNLEDIVNRNATQMEKLQEIVQQLTIDTKVFMAEQSKINESVHDDIKSLSGNDKSMSARLEEIIETFKIRSSLVNMVSKNWWKILALMLPLVGAIGELMVYLRNLPAA